MAKKCTNCQHDNKADARYCSNCGGPLVQGLTSQMQPPKAAQQGLVLHQSSMGASLSHDLMRLYDEFYQASELMHAGEPFWEIFGKHLDADRIRRQLDRHREHLEQLYLRHVEQMHDQQLNHQYRQRQVLLDDEYQRRKLGLQLNRVEDALQALDDFDAGNLSDDAKADLVEELISTILDEVFESRRAGRQQEPLDNQGYDPNQVI
jgi:hypothetical protein